MPIITLNVWSGGAEKIDGGILMSRFICVLIGDLVMEYEIMKSGIYMPLLYKECVLNLVETLG